MSNIIDEIAEKLSELTGWEDCNSPEKLAILRKKGSIVIMKALNEKKITTNEFLADFLMEFFTERSKMLVTMGRLILATQENERRFLDKMLPLLDKLESNLASENIELSETEKENKKKIDRYRQKYNI